MIKKKQIKNTAKMEEDIVFESEDHGESIVAKLRERLKICMRERQEYLDGWQRSKADFVNQKKEQDKERSQFIAFAKEDIIHQILPVLDSFEMAFSNKEMWNTVEKNWRLGVEHIYAQLLGVLEDNEVIQMNPEGEPFNPKQHSSIEVVLTDKKIEQDSIAEVVQRGYLLRGKVIRPARVKVFHYQQK